MSSEPDQETYTPEPGVYKTTADFEPILHWNYVVKGLFRRGETSILFGPSNSGKSALVGLMASCIVAGQSFFKNKTKRGIVVHIAAEGPSSVLECSVAYRTQKAGLECAPYIVRCNAMNLADPDDVPALINELRLISEEHGYGIVLVVFDTLARSIGDCDENNSSHMTRVDNAARRIATELFAHVMLVHHTGKDEVRGARNSSARSTCHVRASRQTMLSSKRSMASSVPSA